MELNITYKRDMNHTYVLFSGDPIESEDYQVQMALHRLVKGILPCSLHTLDGSQIWYCESTSLQKLSSYCRMHPLGKEDLIWIFGGLLQNLLELQDFLINPDLLYLDPEELYLNLFEQRVQCCLVPFYRKDIWESLMGISQYLLSHLDHEDNEAVSLAYSLFRYVSQERSSLEELWNLLYGKKNNSDDKKHPPDLSESRRLQEIDREMEFQRKKDLDEFFGKEKPKEKKRRDKKNKENKEKQNKEKQNKEKQTESAAGQGWLTRLFGRKRDGKIAEDFLFDDGRAYPDFDEESMEDSVMGSLKEKDFFEKRRQKDDLWSEECAEDQEEATTLLAPERVQNTALLFHEKTGERYLLKPPVSMIGKMPDTVQIVLKEATVSRIHARLLCREEGWYLEDLNSKNGTYVNGSLLENGKQVKLNSGDKIRFADVACTYVKPSEG